MGGRNGVYLDMKSFPSLVVNMIQTWQESAVSERLTPRFVMFTGRHGSLVVVVVCVCGVQV